MRKLALLVLCALALVCSTARAQEPARWDLHRAALGVGGHMLIYPWEEGSRATGFGLRPWLSYSLSERLSAVAANTFDFSAPERHLFTAGGRLGLHDTPRWSLGVGVDYARYWGEGYDTAPDRVPESVIAGAYGGWGAIRNADRDLVILKLGAQYDVKQPEEKRWFYWGGLDFQIFGGSD